MNEAFHCEFERCRYSTVAMSVSAAESRLLKLMCLARPEFENALDEKTLGQLVWEYVNNKEKYKNVVPEKHEPLLQLCNVYRIFSVHPKRETITQGMTSSILQLTLGFLQDSSTRPEAVKDTLTSSEKGK